MFDVTEIVSAIITLLGIVITVLIAPILKSKLNNAQQEELAKWVQIAVLAAEQLYKGQGRGDEKLQYVLNWLSNNGIKLDDTRIMAQVKLLIEAFVGELNTNNEVTVA